MKRLAAMLLAIVCIAGCMHDDYTGEPFYIIEFTLDGERIHYEDWGLVRGGFLGSSLIVSYESPGLHLKDPGTGQKIACFKLINPKLIDLCFESDQASFVEGMRYTYKDDPQKKIWEEGVSMIHKSKENGVPEDARITDGWYSFSRKSSEPYGRYEVYFEFSCQGEQRTLEIKDGIIQVGRRFQGDMSSMIRKAE